MGKLILKNFRITIYDNNTPENLKDFNDEVDVNIMQEGKEWCARFTLYIFSYNRLEQYENLTDEAGLYLRFTLIMKCYDEKIIENHIQQILDKCNLQPPEKRFNYLSYYLKSENEEDLYY